MASSLLFVLLHAALTLPTAAQTHPRDSPTGCYQTGCSQGGCPAGYGETYSTYCFWQAVWDETCCPTVICPAPVKTGWDFTNCKNFYNFEKDTCKPVCASGFVGSGLAAYCQLDGTWAFSGTCTPPPIASPIPSRSPVSATRSPIPSPVSATRSPSPSPEFPKLQRVDIVAGANLATVTWTFIGGRTLQTGLAGGALVGSIYVPTAGCISSVAVRMDSSKSYAIRFTTSWGPVIEFSGSTPSGTWTTWVAPAGRCIVGLTSGAAASPAITGVLTGRP